NPAANANWSSAGSTELTGNTVNLTAFAGTLSTIVRKAANLTGSGDTLDVNSVAGFDDSGSFDTTVGGSPATCTYTGRNIDSSNHANFQFTGVPRRRVSLSAGAAVTTDVSADGSGTGINL